VQSTSILVPGSYAAAMMQFEETDVDQPTRRRKVATAVGVFVALLVVVLVGLVVTLWAGDWAVQQISHRLGRGSG
jgi:purine-cytosine permease-like protein